MYLITCKNGYVLTDDAGRIAEDHVGRDYTRTPDDSWRIIGFGKRVHSRRLVTLAAAAAGADIGHGIVHDIDHGTHRSWGRPAYRRAVKVRRV